jgi:glycosyltransferase involved in cell wall biosynthesis
MGLLKQRDTLIIIPAYNEEKNIEKVILGLSRDYRSADILVVNDGSIDNTEKVLQDKGALLINHPFNMGIGVSFETGCKFALSLDYDYIVRMDGDGQHEHTFIAAILAPVKNNETDIAVGSRFLGLSDFKSSFFRVIGISVLSFIISFITRKRVTDPTSGFCAMNKKAYAHFSQNCVEDYPEPEILMHHSAFRIKEVPISIAKRPFGASSITPLKSIYYMVKVLFSLLVGIFR